jgi:hypothetical protein
MMNRTLFPLLGLLLLATGCSDKTGEAQDAAAAKSPSTRASATPAPVPTNLPSSAYAAPSPGEPQTSAAERMVLAVWRKAANRKTCAPLTFGSTNEFEASPRAAVFSGGWGVAFDLPGSRSAYGIAGTGHVPEAPGDSRLQRQRLFEQWPLFRDLPDLPSPAFAGYGYEGEQTYGAAAAKRSGGKHLAYVRVGGQACDYNVWSRMGRAHLETLLANLRLAEPLGE